MKKILFALTLIILLFTGCTKNQMARKYGGTMTIKLEPGQRLMEATWKNDDLFYLTEPMDSDYEPKTKTFHEDSNFGMIESTVIFVETK